MAQGSRQGLRDNGIVEGRDVVIIWFYVDLLGFATSVSHRMLTMDIGKRNQLVARLSQEPGPQIVPIEVFFDGNDDLGSIGCNLLDHPGIAAFRDAFARIARRPGVVAIYAQIAELDPGGDC